MSKRKILFIDIETEPNLAYVWAKYQQDVIAYEQEWSLLSVAWKWEGDKRVKCKARCDFDDDTDKSLCQLVWKLFDKADAVVAHNGNKFDIRKLNARFSYYDMAPYKSFAKIDTKIEAKRHFYFNSNRLNDLAEHLQLGKKVDTGGFELWLKCMKGVKAAWKLMKRYNRHDVDLLEKVYLRLRPWMVNHPNLSLLDGKRLCPHCSSNEVVKNGLRVTHRLVKQEWRCKECSSYFLSPAGKRIANYGEH